VTNRKRKPSEFSYFDEDIYVGVGFLSIAELKKEFSDPKEFWKKAEPSYQILEKSLWDDYHNIIEYSGKLRNGWLKHDEYLTRYSARVIAQHVQRAIIALNDLSIISENYVWHQVLHARKKPRHLRTDYPLALGIKGTPDTQAVYRSAMRLCKETLGVIRVEFGGKAKRPRFRMLLGEPLEKHGL
jgi:hypothetical protein